MKYHQKKTPQTTTHAPEPNPALVRDLLARGWKPEASSLKREDWRRIALEQIG